MTPISEMISEARKQAGMSQSELARKLNLTPQSVQAWESGRSTPRANMLVDIALALDISKVGLFTAMLKSVTEPAFAQAQAYLDAKAKEVGLDQQELDAGLSDIPNSPSESAGSDFYAPSLVEISASPEGKNPTVEVDMRQQIRLEREMIESQGVKSEKVVCAIVQGDSMYPILPDGSVIAIDTDGTVVRDGKTYAINQNGRIRVRTLSRTPRGGLKFRSFNRDAYPDEEYAPGEIEAESISIIGRIIWSSMKWP